MTYKLPPLPDPKYIWHDADEPGEADLFEFEFAGAVDGRCDICERLYTAEHMQAYAIAAIEAQGVPDGYAGSLYVSGGEHCVTVEFESAAQAQAYQNWIASAPPAPQADKYVPCPHCGKNTASDNPSQWCPCPKQASVVQQEPVAWMADDGRVCNARAKTQAMHACTAESFKTPLYSHPAQQAKPQPLSDDRDARIAELEQRNRDLYEDVQRFKEHALNEKDARMALERELAEVRKDAERYRWLRKQHWSENLISVVVRPKDQTMIGSLLPCGSLLDDTVDHMQSAQEATLKGQQ